jgi:hypothetical protein
VPTAKVSVVKFLRVAGFALLVFLGMAAVALVLVGPFVFMLGRPTPWDAFTQTGAATCVHVDRNHVLVQVPW